MTKQIKKKNNITKRNITKRNITKRNTTKKMLDSVNKHKDETKYISISNVELNYNKILELPDGINSLDFQKWIQKIKIYNKGIQILTKYITINP